MKTWIFTSTLSKRNLFIDFLRNMNINCGVVLVQHMICGWVKLFTSCRQIGPELIGCVIKKYNGILFWTSASYFPCRLHSSDENKKRQGTFPWTLPRMVPIRIQRHSDSLGKPSIKTMIRTTKLWVELVLTLGKP